MSKSPNDRQDLQIFLSRPPGAALKFRNDLPEILVTGPSRVTLAGAVRAAESFDDEFPAYVAVANSEAVETVHLPFSPTQLAKFLRGLASDRLSIHDCVNFGALLFDAIFYRSIRDQLRSMQSIKTGLRLTIATSVPELLAIPWEFLCDTQHGVLPSFLCQNQDITLSRSLRLFNRTNFKHQPLSDETLRILVVTASPSNLPPLDTMREEAMFRFILNENPTIVDCEPEFLHNATINELRRKLDTFKPHVIHVCCHGAFNKAEGLGYVALCSEAGDSTLDLVNSFRFASLIQEPKSVRLAFLSTCHGAAQDPIETFSGVAECVHANGIPAVASLQFELLDTTGHAIALNFYRHLLRDRMSVEESINRARQYLALNNHTFKECFGIALFQANCSLALRDSTDPNATTTRSPSEDTDFVRAFQEALRHKTFEKISSVLDQITAPLESLASLTTPDVALILNIFGDIHIGLKILHHIKQAGIPFRPFLNMAKVASILCQTTHEHNNIITSILIYPTDRPDAYMATPRLEISETVASQFFFGDLKTVIGEAIKVNGIDRAFVALTCPDSADTMNEHICSLKSLDEVKSDSTTITGDPRWKRIFAATLDTGCAFIVPDRSRIKIVAAGEQIAEFRQGKWSYTNFADFKQKIAALASTTDIAERVLLDVTQKAMVSSDLGKGRTFVIRQKEGPEPSLAKGYKSVLESAKSELKGKSIIEFDALQYLNLVEGDGATIISHDGQTLAVNAKLEPSPSTNVMALSAGTRHLSAQKITKESATVAIVVSDDGPVTVFFQGQVVFRKA